MHESLEDFEIRCDLTTDCGVSCPLGSEKQIYNGKNGVATFSAAFDRILYILAGNDDIHTRLDEVEIWLDPTPDHRVTCPKASKI